MKHPLKPFEFMLYRELMSAQLLAGHWLVGCSGGIDSMALLHALVKISERYPELKLTAVHVHHGGSLNSETLLFRKNAQELVLAFCQARQVAYLTNAPDFTANFRDEAALRRCRYQYFSQWREELNAKGVILAHHADDLLETRLIRLIRGTGGKGLEAMRLWRQPLLRPFLQISKKQLQQYVSENQISYVSDPSENNSKILRNWIRHEWLPQLEKKRASGVATLARSLTTVAQDLAMSPDAFLHCMVWVEAKKQWQLQRQSYQKLSEVEQRQCLVHYFSQLSCTNYRARELSEIQKRLRSRRGQFSFVVAGQKWLVNAEQFWCEINF